MRKILVLAFCLGSLYSFAQDSAFDGHKWVAPYHLSVPKDWGVERFLIPISFAPGIPYKGVEDIRFTPGWAKKESEEYWTYAFLWWLDGAVAMDAKTLAENMRHYYQGLMEVNNVPKEKRTPVITSFKEIATTDGDLKTFAGTVQMVDYMTLKPITLNAHAHLRACPELKRTVIFYELSPKPTGHANWAKLRQLLEQFRCKAPTVAVSDETLKIRSHVAQNKASIVNEFTQLLAIPNVAADTVGLKNTAAFIMEMMQKRGIQKVQMLPAGTSGAAPAVYGEVIVPGAKQTLIFYAHYDGQPVNPAQWAKGLEPFKPVLYTGAYDRGGKNIPFPGDGNYERDWRIYARGASDDKAGVQAILTAYDVLLKTGGKPTCNLKFFFEGEEEAGSPHLNEILEKHAALLQSDLWVICDGPVHQSGKKQIAFGVRGDAHVELTVYASKRPLHSGHYGNWAPNPAMMLAELLASMKDKTGRVTINGFYDDVVPLSASEKKALSEVPSVDEQMKSELGIAAGEMTGKSLSESINLPSLNINGMHSGNVGKQASNQIPTYATAVLDLRLVLGNDWQRQQQKVIDHIKAEGYFVTDKEPSDDERKKHGKIIKVTAGKDGYNAQRTSMDLPIVQKVIGAVKSTTPEPVVLQPTMGGSLPLFLFEKYLQAKTITVPVANHDNNQHAENENIRLGNLFDGIETMAALMRIR